MANHIKFCSCRGCKAGRHTRGGKLTIQQAVRTNRHKTKAALKSGKDTVETFSVGYTD
jgi:hypothetical protein